MITALSVSASNQTVAVVTIGGNLNIYDVAKKSFSNPLKGKDKI